MKPLLIASATMAWLTIAAPARSDDIRSKDWHWNIDDADALYAATTNSANNLLAQYCDPGQDSCVYAVAFGITCSEDKKYPALVSTDKEARSIEFVCGPKVDEANENLMLASQFDEIDTLVRSGLRIGFVIPLQGDEFKAVRFSLQGAIEAIDRMRKVAERSAAKQTSPKETRPDVQVL